MKSIFTFSFCLGLVFLNAQIGFVGNMFPNTPTSVDAATDLNIFIQVYKSGVTEPAGQGAGINCEVYYGSVTSFGNSWTNITSQNMSYNVDIGNNDEYIGTLNLASGLYEYTCRCTDDAGINWTWLGSNNQLTVNAPLPIYLSKFEVIASQSGNKLLWTTQSEINNSYFEILFSEDGRQFKKIGQKEGVGHSNVEQSYYFEHAHSNKESAYYRLRQVDTDGKYTYSSIKYVAGFRSGFSGDFKVFPNPTSDLLSIEGADLDDRVITISDMSGKMSQRHYTVNGNILDVSSFPSGLYIISIKSHDTVWKTKWIKI